ncbi:flagellar basal body-associated FliL family protein [Fontisphaera persica]|uniref:flagellar basal body-associated FliL family protein n=1 Tax=Fontisphaera persica TaxID=2974023 RepID=UPI0024C0AF2C|nr:flagellar basal body-associated FliL family protein [Fontisphaera persica]WCJ58221.1 flagellar basal body-associated FliL family protein [Fontisphaera persica]
MAANRLENAPAEAPAKGGGAAPAPKASALQAWLPAIVTIILMPVLAFCTTQFLLLPKLQKALGAGAAAQEEPATDKKKQEKTPRQTVQLNKVLVNVAGSVGTRYLMANYTLVGTAPDFKDRIEANRDMLLDLAAGVMSTKTISDLEKPGARNLIRNELISVFNNALGANLVKEIYITEFAIQ